MTNELRAPLFIHIVVCSERTLRVTLSSGREPSRSFDFCACDMRLLAQRAAGEENFASFSPFSGFLRHFFDTTHAKGPRTCASLREKWGPRQNHVLENRLFEPPLQLRLPIAKSRRHERTHATTSACKVRSRAAMARQGWAVQQQGQHGERLKAAAQERRTCTVSTMIEKRKKPQQGHQHVRDSSPRRTTNCQPVSRSPVSGVAGSTCCPDASADHRGRLSGEARGAPRLRGERGRRQRRQQKELLLWQQRRVRLALAAQLPTSQI